MSETTAGSRVRPIDADEATARIDELVEILVDSVAGGNSINFLDDFTPADGAEFWRSSITEQRSGGRVLFVADIDGRIAGTSLLIFAPQPNAPHRAEVGKMLVHSAFRRQGLGAELLGAVEDEARRRGKTLLLLDTATDSSGQALYEANGWTQYGIVPDHSLTPDGRPWPTTFFYKQLPST